MYKFEIPEDYLTHLDHALVRLSFLFPSAELKRDGRTLEVTHSDANEPLDFKNAFKEELYNQLYRERIYQDTLPIKKWLFSKPESKDET